MKLPPIPPQVNSYLWEKAGWGPLQKLIRGVLGRLTRKNLSAGRATRTGDWFSGHRNRW